MFTFRSFCILSTASTVVLGLCSCGNSPQSDPQSRQQQAAALSQQVVHIPANAAGMGSAAFGVNPLSVPAGTSITWENDDTVVHTATSDTGVWDTGDIAPSATSSPVPFNSPGVFPYHSSIDGAASMSGVIEVIASPSPSPSASASASPSPSPSPTPSPSVTASPTPTPTPTMSVKPAPKKPVSR